MIRRRCLAICADTEKSIGRKKSLQTTGTGEVPAGTETSELWEQLDQQNFAENYRSMLQNMAEDVETMSLEQADEHLDVKQLQLVHKQLRLCGEPSGEAGIFSPDVPGRAAGRSPSYLTAGSRNCRCCGD